jgi:hypothetical protein
MNEAIIVAIEKGGYLLEDIKGRKAKVGRTSDIIEIRAGNFIMTIVESMISQDPLFWQALGKAQGWSNYEPGLSYSSWHEFALKYFDLVLTGGDTEQLWKQLIETK